MKHSGHSEKSKLKENQLKSLLFGDVRSVYCYVAEKVAKDSNDRQLAGYALYFPFYSLLRGKCVYMKNIFVVDSYRSKGIGKQLVSHLAKFAVDTNCDTLEFVALEGNEATYKFYDNIGAFNLTKDETLTIFDIYSVDISSSLPLMPV
ncbi:Uncharacterised protein g1538 [Pycnogonum litorale]